MKRIQFAVFFTCLFISLNIKAQQNHFIYIQADNKQPFYVKLDKKLYSSTASGYLVVAKLKAGPYNFVIGFPKNEWPEQYIRCTVEDRDLGYLLKNFGEQGWGFFNLQSLNVLMADNNEKKAEVVENVKSDAFSNMLSSVVNDPAITQNELVKEELKKTIYQAYKEATEFYQWNLIHNDTASSSFTACTRQILGKIQTSIISSFITWKR